MLETLSDQMTKVYKTYTLLYNTQKGDNLSSEVVSFFYFGNAIKAKRAIMVYVMLQKAEGLLMLLS